MQLRIGELKAWLLSHIIILILMSNLLEHEDHPFALRLKDELDVAAFQTALQDLLAEGDPVHIKCEDKICGIGKCGFLSGEVEYVDFLHSMSRRAQAMIICRPWAVSSNGNSKWIAERDGSEATRL